ncbi:MAG: phosphomannomutase [Gammaproteobacteria bacterium]|nr:MAG: phosphomannomutase [Gammaproteobacteria bacterium]
MNTSCFKAYDIRGRVPDDLNPDLARRIAYAYAKVFNPANIVVGRDIRLTSELFADAVMQGLQLAGVNVFDLGLCGTENVYHATASLRLDGGIMVTASHNPMDYNGLKLVTKGARPVGVETGLKDIQAMIEDDDMTLPSEMSGQRSSLDVWDAYVEHLLSYIDISTLKPLKIVANPGNGGAGLVVERIEKALPFEFVHMDFEPDGNFPNGVPNPLLPKNQGRTSAMVRESGADLGIAWDGDYDRCFLFDETGSFVNGYYLMGLIATELLNQSPGQKIVYDPRLTWNTIAAVEEAGGIPVISKTGHSYIKKVMRDQDAIYGGEISGHHYFKAFAYCDSGMIPWLLVTAMLSRIERPLSELLKDYQARFPASDEINQRIENPEKIIRLAEQAFGPLASKVEHIDGLSVEFEDWRFNLRMSNTEPLLRLNVESRLSDDHLNDMIEEVTTFIDKNA